MGKSDITARAYLKDKKRFADFFNGTVFQGRQVIKPSELSACENQANVHYAMPLRTMLYDGIMYTEQAADMWKQRAREKVTSAEFLSQFRTDDKLVPVITLVFYYGTDEWDASTTLHEMLGVEKINEEMLKYIPNYHINLITPDGEVDKELFQTDLQQIFGVLECRRDKDKLRAYMEQEKEYFGRLDRESATAISIFLGSEEIKEKAKTLQKEEMMDMCKALQDIYNDGVGEGREEGREAFLVALIQKKLAKGLSVEEIADMLEITVDEVKKFM